MTNLAFDHLGEQRQPHRHDAIFLRERSNRLEQESPLAAARATAKRSQSAICPAELGEHFAGVRPVETDRPRRIVALDEIDLQVRHEAADGQPEVVADRQQTLHAYTITLPQGSQQTRAVPIALAVQPLLKLVQSRAAVFFAAGQPLTARIAAQFSPDSPVPRCQRTAAQRRWRRWLSVSSAVASR